MKRELSKAPEKETVVIFICVKSRHIIFTKSNEGRLKFMNLFLCLLVCAAIVATIAGLTIVTGCAMSIREYNSCKMARLKADEEQMAWIAAAHKKNEK